MIHTLSGAVNLTRIKGGSFEKAAKGVFAAWGFPEPEKVLVGEHAVENDIEAASDVSILTAVVRRCIELAQRRKFHSGFHTRRRPAAERLPPQTRLSPEDPKPKLGQIELF